MEARLTGIDRAEALRYLGCKSAEPPAELLDDLIRCEKRLLETARPRLVWRRFPLGPDGSPEGTAFSPAGEDVKRLLSGCGAIVFFAATLGAECERLLRQAQASSMADAVLLDALASAAIENVCDNFCADLAAMEAPAHLTDRFSPGYGDMPLTQQEDFCRLLDTSRRIGLTVTPSGLMLPQKSVTALLGISPAPVSRRAGGCAECKNYVNCSYRKEGRSCESS